MKEIRGNLWDWYGISVVLRVVWYFGGAAMVLNWNGIIAAVIIIAAFSPLVIAWWRFCWNRLR